MLPAPGLPPAQRAGVRDRLRIRLAFRVTASMRNGKVHMDHIAPNPSRRAILGALTTIPTAALAMPAVLPGKSALAALWKAYGDEPVTLLRTREGRSLSRERYRRAREFFPRFGEERPGNWPNFLYHAGIAAQLALSSHLLDVGFPDRWCARHIGLQVARSMAYANATGFGHECPDMARLAVVLTPYCKWNRISLLDGMPHDGGFTPETVTAVLDNLLGQVGHVTGHALPRGRTSRRARG